MITAVPRLGVLVCNIITQLKSCNTGGEEHCYASVLTHQYCVSASIHIWLSERRCSSDSVNVFLWNLYIYILFYYRTMKNTLSLSSRSLRDANLVEYQNWRKRWKKKNHRLLTSWNRKGIGARMTTEREIGRIPILVSNSGVPCAFEAARFCTAMKECILLAFATRRLWNCTTLLWSSSWKLAARKEHSRGFSLLASRILSLLHPLSFLVLRGRRRWNWRERFGVTSIQSADFVRFVRFNFAERLTEKTRKTNK